MRNSSSLFSSACAARSSSTAGGTSVGRGSSARAGVGSGAKVEVVVRVAEPDGVEVVELVVAAGLAAFGAGAGGVYLGAGAAAGGVDVGAVSVVEDSEGGVKTVELPAGADAALPAGVEKKDETGPLGTAAVVAATAEEPSRASSAAASFAWRSAAAKSPFSWACICWRRAASTCACVGASSAADEKAWAESRSVKAHAARKSWLVIVVGRLRSAVLQTVRASSIRRVSCHTTGPIGKTFCTRPRRLGRVRISA